MSAISKWVEKVSEATALMKKQEKELFMPLEAEAREALISSVLDVMKEHPRLMAVRFSSYDNEEYGTYFVLSSIKIEGRKIGKPNTSGGEEDFEEVGRSDFPQSLKPIIDALEIIEDPFDRSGFYPAPAALLQRSFDCWDKCVDIDRAGKVSVHK